MTGNTDIRLLGFSGFKASERFLRALHNEILVSTWQETQVSAKRPRHLTTGDEMRAAIERPSSITVVSAHAGSFGGKLGISGETTESELTLDRIGTLGATSMLLIDACCGPALKADFESHARSGSVIAFLDYGRGKNQITRGRDSVTAIGAVIRELCYPPTPDLSSQGCLRAIELVNIQISARNDAEDDQRKARPPLLSKHECR